MKNLKEDNRKQFNVLYRNHIERGEYTVETEDGNPVKIISWDYCPGDFHIAVIVQEKIPNKKYLTDGILVLYNDIGATLSNKRFFLYLKSTKKTLHDVICDAWRRCGSSLSQASFEEMVKEIIDFAKNEKA